jgi:PAS domain S-box-containing protein
MAGWMSGWVTTGPELLVAGGVGAMALVALLWFFAHRRDPIPLWLGLFCVCLCVYFLLGAGHVLEASVAFAAGTFLVLYAAELYQGGWQRFVAGCSLAAAATGVSALMLLPPSSQPLVHGYLQVFAVAVAAMVVAATVHVMRERRSFIPLAVTGTALGYPLLVAGYAPLWLILVCFVLMPAVGLVRRFSRAFDAETRRSLNQAKFTSDLFESVPAALAMRDPQGKYQVVNRTWETYYGLKREEILGTTPRARASARDADALLALDRATMAKGLDTGHSEVTDMVYRDKRFMQTRTAIADSQGKVLGVLIASLDVTERYAMEQALITEQRRLALVVRGAQVGIIDWDGAAHTIYYSARFKEILGHPSDADTSKWADYFDLIHPEDRVRVEASFSERILAKGPEGAQELHEPIQYRLQRADGSYVWIEGVGVSVRDGRGDATRFIGSVADITERRAYEEALRESVRLRDEVERMARHDLKTPLNSIIAVPRLLREGRKLDSEEQQLLSIVERAGYRLLDMVNLSLDLFRMEQGSYVFRPQAVDLDDMVRKVSADLESHAESKNVSMRIMRVADPAAPPGAPRTGPVFARGEDLLCYSMLANLLKNAIEASPEDGAVTVTLEARSAPVVHIHNLGAVPESVRASFFEKYATSGKAGGLGLGTYSALLMARVQQGNISMRTSAEEGTTVTVQFAEAAADSAAATPGAPSAGDRVPSRMPQLPPRHVLIVDDDEFNRLVMRRYLPSPPLTVVMAVNGRAALAALRRQPFDFVFLDLEMPVMSGYEAAERIRSLEREEGRKPTTLVAFSSNDDEASIRRALAAGCDHYLTKPAPRETLWKLLAGGTVAQEKKSGKAPEFSDPVEVDVDLRPTLAAFFVSRRKALDEIDTSLARSQRAGAKRLAHKLSGSFSLYGFKWAAAQCRLIEQAAEAGERDEIAGRIEHVRQHLNSVQVRFVESAAPA